LWLHSLKVAQLLRSAACLHTNQSRSYLNHLVFLLSEGQTLQMLFRKSENIRQKNTFHALTENPVLHGGEHCRNEHSHLCLVNN